MDFKWPNTSFFWFSIKKLLQPCCFMSRPNPKVETNSHPSRSRQLAVYQTPTRNFWFYVSILYFCSLSYSWFTFSKFWCYFERLKPQLVSSFIPSLTKERCISCRLHPSKHYQNIYNFVPSCLQSTTLELCFIHTKSPWILLRKFLELQQTLWRWWKS